jgi:hypothetical protein
LYSAIKSSVAGVDDSKTGHAKHGNVTVLMTVEATITADTPSGSAR